jgi:prefoldin subunit 5
VAESNPLVGLNADQADAAIERLADKIRDQKESLKAAQQHLADMKAARKDLVDPQPTDNGIKAAAGTAQVGVEGGEL